MSVLEIKNLTQFYDERYIFNSANLTVNNGEHIGVVGLNGAGKSTFINIIAGNLSWDEGEVNWLSGIRRGYLDQYATLDGSLTVMEYLQDAFSYLFELNEKLEDIYAKMGEVSDADELDKLINKSSRIQDELTEKHFYDIDSQIKKVANGLGVGAIGYDKLISTLSGGQSAKLMLSKLLLQDLDIISDLLKLCGVVIPNRRGLFRRSSRFRRAATFPGVGVFLLGFAQINTWRAFRLRYFYRYFYLFTAQAQDIF